MLIPTKEMQVVDADQLEKFVRTIRAGGRCVYHRGLLMRDREKVAEREDGSDHKLVAELGNMALALHAQGLITLVQRRLGEDDYEYIAIRTDRPAASYSTAPVALAA